MTDTKKLEAIQEVLKWVESGKQSTENGLEEIQYILDGGIVNKNDDLHSVVGQSEQLSLSDFRVGFEYEELQMDSERYLNKGMIWVKKIYGLNSPRLHKMQKLLDEGKLRKA
jgi:hypothetical protein